LAELSVWTENKEGENATPGVGVVAFN